MGNNSRKKSRSNKTQVLSIPELRSAFDRVESFVSDGIRQGKSSKSLAAPFQKVWQQTFGKPMKLSAARAYINQVSKTVSMTRRRKHRGGSHALAGAPLDFVTRPGAYGTYGNFLPYVNSGFVNPEIGRPVGNESLLWPTVPPGMGMNTVGAESQVGGGRRNKKTRRSRGGSFFAGLMRPFIAETPTTTQANIATSWRGQVTGPNSDPTQTAYSYKMPPVIPAVPGADIAGLDRNLLQDIRV